MYKYIFSEEHNIKATDLNKVESIARSLSRYCEKDIRDVANYIAGTNFDGLDELIQLILEYFSLYDVNFNAGCFYITNDVDPIVRTILGQAYNVRKS